jgi:hypothetical protein
VTSRARDVNDVLGSFQAAATAREIVYCAPLPQDVLGLSIFGPLVGKEARLKRLFRKLGRARNMDVHRQAAQRGNRRTSKIVFNIMISQDDLAFRFGNFSELFRMDFKTFARSGLHTFTLVTTSTNLGRLDGSDGE